MNWTNLYKDQTTTYDSPIILNSFVVHGFGRGSKELGIPTANLEIEQLGEKGDIKNGIYYGMASVQGINMAFSTVVSVGWNPFYKNEKKTIEAHLLAHLDDFYDKKISLCLVELI
jgi:riboflavin kinase